MRRKAEVRHNLREQTLREVNEAVTTPNSSLYKTQIKVLACPGLT